MIESHFELRRRAFPSTPDHSCYYPATGHERALQKLLEGLADGEGLLVLTGGPGLGKTLLCHCLLDRLGEQRQPGKPVVIEAAFLIHTHFRDRLGLLQALAHDLSLPMEGRGEQELRLALIDHILEQHGAGKRVVLVIDEAHHLSPDLLEELRLLGNLEGHGGKAVQVVLVGLTDLLNTLQYPELAAFRQRISIRSHLEPLSLEESADYLLAHLRAAGGRAERIFGMEALELLARQTGGIPRLLNQAGHLCLRLAAENGVSEVDVEVALEALAALGLAEPEMPDRESSPGEGFSVEQGESVADPSCRLFVAPARTA